MEARSGDQPQTNGDMFQDNLDLDINYSAVERKVPVLVDIHRTEGRKEPFVDHLAPEIVLNPETKLTKKNTGTTGVKMTKPHTNKILDSKKASQTKPASSRAKNRPA